ncbi:MAG: Ig-like domain-containing protein [Acidobacteria bacterium]|nr:Ig-like domain-containing protein [Acidobacteriota bacterium]
MSRIGRRTALILAAPVLAFWLKPHNFVSPVAESSPGIVSPEMSENQEPGLAFRLSEGVPEEAAVAAAPVAPADRLTDAEAAAVFARMPPLESAPADVKDFALREKSLPPPRPGTTIAEELPPPAPATGVRPVGVDAGPLKVLRHAPEGEVPLAPHLSMTFSQPMVAITSLAEIEKQPIAVQLTPTPPGKWRWVGAQTLLFEPDGRFPMATTYQVAVPAETKSAAGASLVAPVTWAFSTPPPQLVSKFPENGPVRRDPILFAAFDQKIEPSAVLKTIRVRAVAAHQPIRLARADEIAADPRIRQMSEGAGDGRWIAFRAESLLPVDSKVDVAVGPGTPSAEGPRKTEKLQSWTFRTYGPLRVAGKSCGWNNQCPPFTPWEIRFTNPIDAKKFDASMVTVDPELPAMNVSVAGTSIYIRGRSKGRTTYRVKLSPAIVDELGNELGSAETVQFDVTPAPQSLWLRGGPMVVLDPTGPRRLSVFTTNHPSLKVRVYAVGPEEWRPFLEWLRTADDERAPKDPPGRRVLNTTVKPKSDPDELVETPIDLAPVLSDGLGQVILVVEPTVQPKERWQRRAIRLWVQSTHIALDAFVDDTELHAWASSLDDGRPLDGVDVSLLPSGRVAKTGGDGIATLDLHATSGGLLLARRGKDIAILPENTSWWGGDEGWRRRDPRDRLIWYVFDDRKMYRPGEEVKIKGWVRKSGTGKDGDVGSIGIDRGTVSYTLFDSRENKILDGQVPLNPLAGFDFSLKLPATMNLGSAALRIGIGPEPNADGTQYDHSFDVQEFRRPEYEVAATPSDGPYFVGEHANVTVTASYYAGGALPNADVTWHVTATDGHFTPPNRDDFVFGVWTPWWELREIPGGGRERSQSKKALTDSGGKHILRIDFDAANPPRPANVVAEAAVMDVNRQSWSASTNMLVHPSSLYVGIRSDRVFVQKGEPLRIDSIVSDLDGKAIPGRRVTMHAVRVEWVQRAGEWREEETDSQQRDIVSTGDPVRTTFETKEGGQYKVRAIVVDDRDRQNMSEMTIWVAGGKLPPKRNVEQETVTLVPDKKEYRAGDTAEILVIAPFAPAEGLLTLRRSGIISTERLTLHESSQIVKVKIEEAYTPNLYAQVDLAGAAPRANDSGVEDPKLPKRPAYATGSISLSIPPAERTLALSVVPRAKQLEPGGETVIDVELRGAGGRPVAGGEIAVVVVDEAVLSLTGYRLPDPLSVFYEKRDGCVRDHYLRGMVLLSRPEDLPDEEVPVLSEGTLGGAVPESMPPPAPMMMKMAAPMAEAPADGGHGAAPIRMRTDFNALALFAASLPTDAQGRATVSVKLPDSLTRYRVMAVAVAGGRQFGSSETTITARLPLMVRPSPPRFLNFGDRFELPVVVQNQTDAPLRVDVVARTTNASLTDGAGRRVTVPANDRVEVRFPAAAASPGTARFQVGAVSGKWADAGQFELPVWTPATTEAFATYGQIDEGAIAQPVKAPAGVVTGFGGLEITTSSTALHALTDAVLYLVSYRFECAEQLSSRIIAVAALRDVLTAFEAEGLPKPEAMVAAVKRDIERLRGIQNSDGGFAFWKRGDESWPYISIHAAHALERAKSKGFDVPASMLDRSLKYMRTIEKHIPKWYPDSTRRTLIAYALYVRNRLGDRDPGRARKLIQETGLENLPLEAVGWLLPVLSNDTGSATIVTAIRRHLENRVEETAGAAHFTTNYDDGAHLLLHSNRRTDGILLEALIGEQPQSSLIPKLVAGLLAHRTAGRWTNTQENAFILLALDRYFNTYEKTTPDFVARVWLGDQYAGEQVFKGRSTDRHHIEIPMKTLAQPADLQNLTLSREGKGRLYYRIGMQYAPSDLVLPPADYGFTVERTYEGVDAKEDVTRDSDGRWHVKAGARVRVRLTMVTPARRYHVALVDPMPAGFEAMNPELAVTGSLPPASSSEVTVVGGPGLGGPEGHWWWWRRRWFDHENMRDERVEAFTALLWEGVYTYSYIARATTPGTFVVPPPKAEEMYAPETFGRGGGDRVIVE